MNTKENSTPWQKVGSGLLFPARLVHTVMYYFFFLQMNKGTHGGSAGPTALVLGCVVNILLHLGFAVLGLSYWQLCALVMGENNAIVMYLLVFAVSSYLLLGRVYTDKTIQDMAFIHSTPQRKLASLLAFFVIVPGMPLLNYAVAMWTLEPWY